MQAVATAVHTMPGVSAASGVELTADGSAWVCGDDSVYLYRVATSGADVGTVLERAKLLDSKDVVDEGIRKAVKPDFEAMCELTFDGTPCVVSFGSGSKAGARDGVVIYNPVTKTSTVVNAGSLMDALRADARITGTAKLNLEAAATLGPDTVALFQRGNVPGGHNAVALFDRSAFLSYLSAHASATTDTTATTAGASASASAPPAYRVVHLALPPVTETDGARRSFPAGVSGASTLHIPPPPPPTTTTAGTAAAAAAAGGADGGAAAAAAAAAVDASPIECLLVSASYEGTLNEIDDGDVLGSRLALVPAAELLVAAAAAAAAATAATAAPPVVDLSTRSVMVTDAAAGGGVVLAKIEGVAARGVALAPATGNLTIDAIAVTDPDGGASQLLEVTVTIPHAAVTAAKAG